MESRVEITSKQLKTELIPSGDEKIAHMPISDNEFLKMKAKAPTNQIRYQKKARASTD
jgi:hypothetical protein